MRILPAPIGCWIARVSVDPAEITDLPRVAADVDERELGHRSGSDYWATILVTPTKWLVDRTTGLQARRRWLGDHRQSLPGPGCHTHQRKSLLDLQQREGRQQQSLELRKDTPLDHKLSLIHI